MTSNESAKIIELNVNDFILRHNLQDVVDRTEQLIQKLFPDTKIHKYVEEDPEVADSRWLVIRLVLQDLYLGATKLVERFGELTHAWVESTPATARDLITITYSVECARLAFHFRSV